MRTLGRQRLAWMRTITPTGPGPWRMFLVPDHSPMSTAIKHRAGLMRADIIRATTGEITETCEIVGASRAHSLPKETE